MLNSLEVEARVGIEPTHKGFADLSLTTWVPRLGWATFRPFDFEEKCTADRSYLERETGVEPATSSLARKHSTTELLPLSHDQVYRPASCWSNRRKAWNSIQSTVLAPFASIWQALIKRYARARGFVRPVTNNVRS